MRFKWLSKVIQIVSWYASSLEKPILKVIFFPSMVYIGVNPVSLQMLISDVANIAL